MVIEEGEENVVYLHGKYCYLSDNSVNNKPFKSISKKITKDEYVDFAWIKLDFVHSDFFLSLNIRK